MIMHWAPMQLVAQVLNQLIFTGKELKKWLTFISSTNELDKKYFDMPKASFENVLAQF